MQNDIIDSQFKSPVSKYFNLKNKTDEFINKRVQFFFDGVTGQELHKKLKIPYLKLPLPPFDAAEMLGEARSVEGQSVRHRSKDSHGWKSLCIHGITSDKTMSSDRYGFRAETEAPYVWTDISLETKETTRFLKELLKQKYFEELYRVRFMYLEPGGIINFHQDREENSLGPLNIALNMPKNCHWIFEKWGEVPFEPGTGNAVDVSNRHGVWNLSNETRIHIIVHGRYGKKYYESIEEAVSLKKQELKKSKSNEENQKNVHTNIISTKSELFFECILWQANFDLNHPELFSHCANMTEHFIRLKSNRHHYFSTGLSLTSLLTDAVNRKSKWAFVCSPGTFLKDQFFSQTKTFLNSLEEKVFIVGHLLDRKERWFGLHSQAFFINVQIWDRLGRPEIGFNSYEQELPNVERSLDNVHDDYTPLCLKKGKGYSNYKPRVCGWNWIRAGLNANFEFINIPENIRNKKLYLYPEQNQENLLKRFNNMDLGLSDLKQKGALSDDQEKVFKDLHIESQGLQKKLFLFNTEQVRSPYQEGRIKKIDIFCGLPAGFMDMHLLQRHQFSDSCELIYFDINDSMLKIKNDFYTNWQGSDFETYLNDLKKREPDIFENKLLIVDEEDIQKKWEDELDVWGGEDSFNKAFRSIKNLKKTFICLDIINEQQLIIDELKKHHSKSVALWYSNCFNYTPSLAQNHWKMEKLKSRGISFMNSLAQLSQKNNLKIIIYGEDVVSGTKTSRFGLDIHDIFN